MVNSLSWVAFSSKNSVLNFSRFSCGMGCMIMVIWGGEGCATRAIRVFSGIFRIIGKWSEFKFWSWSVIDDYVVACCVFI